MYGPVPVTVVLNAPIGPVPQTVLLFIATVGVVLTLIVRVVTLVKHPLVAAPTTE